MRNSSMIRSLIAMSLMFQRESLHSFDRTPPTTSKREPTPTIFTTKKFHEQATVKATIKDWHQILLGQSKKGKMKQKRVVNTVNTWLNDKDITEEQIENIIQNP